MGNNPSPFKDPFQPVEFVTWNEVMALCRRLTLIEAYAGRLPSGFVCHLPTAMGFDELAGLASLQIAVTSLNQIQQPAPSTGNLPFNHFGLDDMLGNVWKWCQDWNEEARRFKVAKDGSRVNEADDLSASQGPRSGMDSQLVHAMDVHFGPVRWGYPDQEFWARGFRCVLARPCSDTETDSESKR